MRHQDLYKDGMGIRISQISYIIEKYILLFQVHLMELENNAFLYNVEETLYLQIKSASMISLHYAVTKIWQVRSRQAYIMRRIQL